MEKNFTIWSIFTTVLVYINVHKEFVFYVVKLIKYKSPWYNYTSTYGYISSYISQPIIYNGRLYNNFNNSFFNVSLNNIQNIIKNYGKYHKYIQKY